MVVEQQGVIANRPNEHIGKSDGGIIMMRQMMRDSLAAVQEGRDPLCIIRDPSRQVIDWHRCGRWLSILAAGGESYSGSDGRTLTLTMAR